MTQDRAVAIEAFLRRIGWAAADRAHLAGDASARSYLRLRRGGQTAVLMDSPPGSGGDVGDFIRIAAHLAGLGLSSPRILEAETEAGFLLLEDLGDALFTRVVQDDPALEQPLYAAAVDVLLTLQAAAPPKDLPNLSASDWAEAATFAPRFYATAITEAEPDLGAFRACLARALQAWLTDRAS